MEVRNYTSPHFHEPPISARSRCTDSVHSITCRSGHAARPTSEVLRLNNCQIAAATRKVCCRAMEQVARQQDGSANLFHKSGEVARSRHRVEGGRIPFDGARLRVGYRYLDAQWRR